jgi:hypothetical protein
MWDPVAGPEVVSAYRGFIAPAPDDIGGAIKYHTAPAKDWVSERLAGSLACTALVTYAGAHAPARAVIRPMLDVGHVGEMIVPSPSEQVLVPLGGAVARGPADYPVPWAPCSLARILLWIVGRPRR